MTCARFQVRHNLQLMDLIWHFVKYWAYFRTPLSLFLCPSLYFPADFVRDAYKFVGDSGSCDRPALYCPEEVMAIRGHHWFLGGKRTTTNVSFSDFYWTVAYPDHSGHRLVTSSLWLDLGLASCLVLAVAGYRHYTCSAVQAGYFWAYWPSVELLCCLLCFRAQWLAPLPCRSALAACSMQSVSWVSSRDPLQPTWLSVKSGHAPAFLAYSIHGALNCIDCFMSPYVAAVDIFVIMDTES